MTTLREWLLILGVFTIAAALWYPIIYPRPVVQSFAYDMRDSTIHIWGDEKVQKPIRMQIPDVKKIDIPAN